jgi:hypothetical protein
VKLIYKLGGEGLMMRCQWRVHQWFAKRAVKHLEGSELIHGWSQWSEPSLRWAKQRGIPTVLERSSAQIEEQSRLLREERGDRVAPLPTLRRTLAAGGPARRGTRTHDSA